MPENDTIKKSRPEESIPPEEMHRRTETGLREALDYVHGIVDTIREPLLVLDGKLHVITANRAFYQVFQVSPEDTEGRFLYDLGNGQWNIPALRQALEDVLPQKKSLRDFEVVHDFPSLGLRVMLLNGQKLMREGDYTELILLAIEDITERNRLEDELLRSNEDLQRFAYVAAHDLRSPLNSALNICQLLAQRLQGKLDAKESEMLARAVESLQRLGALMQDILTYSAISSAPRQLTAVPLEESVQVALANLQSAIKANQAEITVTDLPSARGDRTQLTLVMQNLISNAIKYRRTDAPRIRIEAAREGDHWRVSVSDNGQGLEAKYATRIFEPFKRLHGTDIPGSGIGLATCKRIVERLGGRIWVDSTPGEGSTFNFTVPAEKTEPG